MSETENKSNLSFSQQQQTRRQAVQIWRSGKTNSSFLQAYPGNGSSLFQLLIVFSLQDNDEYADLNITCKGTTFRAHKNIICPQSLFSRNACKKESFKVFLSEHCSAIRPLDLRKRYQEGETGIIDLPEDEPLAVKALLDFLYTADYEAYDQRSIILLAQTYTLADKYDLEALKSLALSNLENDSAHIGPLYSPIVAVAVQCIYENTKESDQARSVIVLKTVQNLDRLLWDKEREFSAMIASLGEFGRKVVRALRCCTELGLDRRYFHARPSILNGTITEDTSQDDYDDDGLSESEASAKPRPLTGYRCK